MDVEGVVLGPHERHPFRGDLGDGSTGSALPALTDDRSGVSLIPGERVDPVDLEAVRARSAHLTPESISQPGAGPDALAR